MRHLPFWSHNTDRLFNLGDYPEPFPGIDGIETAWFVYGDKTCIYKTIHFTAHDAVSLDGSPDVAVKDALVAAVNSILATMAVGIEDPRIIWRCKPEMAAADKALSIWARAFIVPGADIQAVIDARELFNKTEAA